MKQGVCAYCWVHNGRRWIYWAEEPSKEEQKMMEEYVQSLTESTLIFWEDVINCVKKYI